MLRVFVCAFVCAVAVGCTPTTSPTSSTGSTATTSVTNVDVGSLREVFVPGGDVVLAGSTFNGDLTTPLALRRPDTSLDASRYPTEAQLEAEVQVVGSVEGTIGSQIQVCAAVVSSGDGHLVGQENCATGFLGAGVSGSEIVADLSTQESLDLAVSASLPPGVNDFAISLRPAPSSWCEQGCVLFADANWVKVVW
jgi:hypothetical protein